MTTANPTIADALLAAARSGAASVEVAITVVVESYNTANQTATVRPAVRGSVMDRAGGLVAVESPAVQGVPVLHLAGGGRSFTFGLAAGDYATALIRSRSHDEVDSGTVTPVTAASSRRWNWSDAVIIPAYRPPVEPLGASAVRGDGQPVLALGALEALFVGASTASIALARADITNSRLNDLKIAHDSHKHPVSGATTGPPDVLAGPATSVATSRVMVDD